MCEFSKIATFGLFRQSQQITQLFAQMALPQYIDVAITPKIKKSRQLNLGFLFKSLDAYFADSINPTAFWHNWSVPWCYWFSSRNSFTLKFAP